MKVDDFDLSFTLRAGLHLYWQDKRIISKDESKPIISMRNEALDIIYKPDLYIYALIDYKPTKILEEFKALYLRENNKLE